MENKTNNISNDEIDLKEIIYILIRHKKTIFKTIIVTVLLAIIYLIIATPWYEVKAFIEIGKYRENNQDILLENGKKVSQRLSVKYIDIYQNIKDRDVKTVAIESVKKNEDFISIVVLGKSNEVAKREINKIISELQSTHKLVINEIKEIKLAKINTINRKIENLNQTTIKNIENKISFLLKIKLPNLSEEINLIKNNKIPAIDKEINILKDDILPSINQKIHYIQKNQIPSIDKKVNYIKKSKIPSIDEKIQTLKNVLSQYEKQFHNAQKNLSKISTKDPSLGALRLMQIQEVERQISRIKIDIIGLEDSKKLLLEEELISLENQKDFLQKQEITKLKNEKNNILQKQIVDLQNKKYILLKEELPSIVKNYKEIETIKLPELRMQKDVSLKNSLQKLLEEKKLITISMYDYNFKNSKLVGQIIIDDNPIKPKKIIILFVALVGGIFLSFFIVFLLEIKAKLQQVP